MIRGAWLLIVAGPRNPGCAAKAAAPASALLGARQGSFALLEDPGLVSLQFEHKGRGPSVRVFVRGHQRQPIRIPKLHRSEDSTDQVFAVTVAQSVAHFADLYRHNPVAALARGPNVSVVDKLAQIFGGHHGPKVLHFLLASSKPLTECETHGNPDSFRCRYAKLPGTPYRDYRILRFVGR